MELKKNEDGIVFVDLGGGTKPHPKASLVLDSSEHAKCDIVCDISKKLPFDDNTVDQFYSLAVLEHLTHVQNRNLFEEIARCLKSKGKFWFRVPHFFSPVAADDPTHNSFWTLKTIEYFAGERMKHVFNKKRLKVCKQQVIVEFPTPLTFCCWPRFRFPVKGGYIIEQFAKLPFTFSYLEIEVTKVDS